MPSLPMSEGGPVIPKVQQSAEDDENLLEAGFNAASDRGVFIIFLPLLWIFRVGRVTAHRGPNCLRLLSENVWIFIISVSPRTSTP